MIAAATWIAVPLAALTTVSTISGGLVAVRARRELETLIALTGGIVVAVALFDVLPEAFDAVGNSRTVTWLVGAGFLAFFLAERALVLHHRDDAEHALAHSRIGALGALRVVGAQLHRRARNRPRLPGRHLDRAAGLHRRRLTRLRRRHEHGGVHPPAGRLRPLCDAVARARRGSADLRRDRRHGRHGQRAASRLPARRLRRVLPLHGRDRPPAGGARSSVAATGSR